MTTERLPLSVCMMVSNEAHRIRRTLDSVADWAGEIVVVTDPKVTDGTDKIAATYGAKVICEPSKGPPCTGTSLRRTRLSRGFWPWTPRSGFPGTAR